MTTPDTITLSTWTTYEEAREALMEQVFSDRVYRRVNGHGASLGLELMKGGGWRVYMERPPKTRRRGWRFWR